MSFTPEQMKKVKDLIAEKSKLNCPSCGQRNWSLTDGITMMPIAPDPTKFFLGVTPSLPCATMVCMVCANTMFFNVMMLGLGDYFGLKGPKGENNG